MKASSKGRAETVGRDGALRIESDCGLLKEVVWTHNSWWKEETLEMQPNNLFNFKMWSRVLKIKIHVYLIPSLSMVLEGLTKGPIAGTWSKIMVVWWGLQVILVHTKFWGWLLLKIRVYILAEFGSRSSSFQWFFFFFLVNWCLKLELRPH